MFFPIFNLELIILFMYIIHFIFRGGGSTTQSRTSRAFLPARPVWSPLSGAIDPSLGDGRVPTETNWGIKDLAELVQDNALAFVIRRGASHQRAAASP